MNARQVLLDRLADDMVRLSNMTLGDLADLKAKNARQEEVIASLMIEAAWTPTPVALDERTWV